MLGGTKYALGRGHRGIGGVHRNGGDMVGEPGWTEGGRKRWESRGHSGSVLEWGAGAHSQGTGEGRRSPGGGGGVSRSSSSPPPPPVRGC